MDNEDILKEKETEAPVEESSEDEQPKKKKVKIVAPEKSDSEESAHEPAKLFVNPLLGKKAFKEDAEEPKKTVDEDGYEWSSDEEVEDKK